MIEIRKSQDRGQANHGWLKSQHSFRSPNTHDRSMWSSARCA